MKGGSILDFYRGGKGGMSLLTNYVCRDFFCKTLLVVDHRKVYQKKKVHNFLINDFAVILLIGIDN